MAKDEIEQSRLRRKGNSSSHSFNLYAIVVDENQREGGTGREKRGAVVYFFQPTRHGERWGIGRSDALEKYKRPNPLVGYHDLHALNGT